MVRRRRRRLRRRSTVEHGRRSDRGSEDAQPALRAPRPVHRLDVVALVVALAPFVVAIVRAAASDWMPVGDAAYFTVRSRDVLSGHAPLVGAWSSGSYAVGSTVNNLGPLQLDALAPFTSIGPYLGTAVGTACINAAAVAAVWMVAVRLLSPGRVVAVMTGVSVLVATLGLSWLIDARQQSAMVLPLLALLWLVAGMAAGLDIALPVGVVAASFVAQTHFTYVVPAAIALVAGLAGWALAARHGARVGRRGHAVAAAAVAAVVCWIQPLIDQFFGSGNLGEVLASAGDGESATGLSNGLQIVAGAVLVPPLWLPGSLTDFLRPDDGIGLGAAIAVVIIWLAAAVVVAILGVRRRLRIVVAIAAISALMLVAAVLSSAITPQTSFGLVPQNYYWLWAVGSFVTTGLLIGVSHLSPVGAVSQSRRPWRRPALLAGLTIVIAIAVWPRYPLPGVHADERAVERIGATMREELADAFEGGMVSDPVTVDLAPAGFGNRFYYVVLIELQRAGIEFRFAPGDANLARFGSRRCADMRTDPRLVLIGGPEPQLDAGSIVLARVDGMSASDDEELDRLDARFGDLLRAGDVRVDVQAVREIDGDVTGLLDVVGAGGRSASGLAKTLAGWRTAGLVGVPGSAAEAFEEWVELEGRSIADVHTLALAPGPSAAATGRATCPD